ncbi:ATP-binding cassette domain-containing protein [Microbacterium sp. LWH7-1.2]|uniref:ABC transporter ATP-binding protein n=1 Tax=Microbacterium sp. LWH7-1.2 TaxID=3135257 RepID=UPI0031395E92
MPEGQSLEFSGVTKRFGAVTAVAGLTARVEPGMVTGFLGPNGAGKTTTLRVLLGLEKPTEGHATIGGRRYAELDQPLQTVGAVLEASSFHPGRTAAAHLTIYAQAAGIAKSRVGEVLDLVGLTDAANRKVGGYSLGMRQRLGLAYALLGDPGVLVLDEPANGLDPEGIRWMRGFLRQLAGEGRTVLVSSHLLAEVQQTVDALLIISRGRLVFQGGVDELTDPREYATVVDSPDRPALSAALKAAGVAFEVLRSGLTVRGVDPTAVGAAAAAGGVALSSLHRRGPALEEVFLDLVNGTRVHPSAAGHAGSTDAAPPAAPVAATPPDSEEAAESALTAAELDAEATAAPGAASALAAAAGAAWAAERDEPDPSPRTLSELASRNAESKRPEHEADTEPDVPPVPGPVAYAVASTGVIDIVPSAPPEDADPDVEAIGQIDQELSAESEPAPEPAPQPEPRPEVEPATEAEAVPEPASEPEAEAEPEPEPSSSPEPGPADPWAPEDANPDVDAIGEIDDELSTLEPPDADDDRPWEHYVKTDSDIEADAFFAAFDHTASSGQSEPEPEPQGEPEPEPEPGPDAELEPEAWVPPEAEAFEDAVTRTPPAADAEAPHEPGDEASVAPSDADPAADAVTAPADEEGGDR